MKKMILSLLMMTLLVHFGASQKTMLITTNAQKVDEKRFGDTKGSPFYFSENVKATLIASNGDEVKDVLLNFNGLTKQVEVFLPLENKMLILDERDWAKIEISSEGNKKFFPKGSGEKIVFRTGVHTRFRGKFVPVLWEGENFVLAKDFKVSETSNTIESPGKTLETKRFKKTKKFYLIQGKKTTELKLKKKHILNTLENAKQLEKFIKKEKLKLNSEKDLIKFLVRYDEVAF